MSRLARKHLADMRAMEEQELHETMHGSGHYIGRGGVPSMGVSQFRGGLNVGAFRPRIAMPKVTIPKFTAPKVRLPTIPKVNIPKVNIPKVNIPKVNIPKVKLPSISGIKGKLPKNAAELKTMGRSLGKKIGKNKGNIVKAAITAGVPIAMLADYLANKSNVSPDAGVYDAYAGEMGTTGSTGATGADAAAAAALAAEQIPAEIVDSMNNREIDWYLKTGNLPDWYYKRRGRGYGSDSDSESDSECCECEDECECYGRKKGGAISATKLDRLMAKYGSGKRTKSKRTNARAEIVKQVMREHGVSLGEASRIVKEQGLY